MNIGITARIYSRLKDPHISVYIRVWGYLYTLKGIARAIGTVDIMEYYMFNNYK